MMRDWQVDRTDDPLAIALADLQTRIQAAYPAAWFTTLRGEDPDGVYLRVTIGDVDPDEVLAVVVDQLLHYQVEQELPVYVVIVPPAEQIARELAAVRRAPLPASRYALGH